MISMKRNLLSIKIVTLILLLFHFLIIPFSYQLLNLNNSPIPSFISQAQASPLQLGAKKFAVILFNFQDIPTQPLTPSQVKDQIFTGALSANNYFKEVSYNKLLLVGKLESSGDVFGWYTLNTNSTCTSNIWWSWYQAANAMAQADGKNLDNYDGFLYVHPPTCGYWGITRSGYTPGVSIFPSDHFLLMEITHEIGHQFGIIDHANKLDCRDANNNKVPISNQCTEIIYNDPYSSMGNLYARHYNADEKNSLGWLISNNNQVVTRNGTYTIKPLEFLSDTVQNIRIPREFNAQSDPIKFYDIEFRQPSTFDPFSPTAGIVNGVLIHITQAGYIGAKTQLITVDPSSSLPEDEKIPLKVGQTLVDIDKGISIRTVSTSSAGATIEITFNASCSRANPVISASPTSLNPVAPNTPVNYRVTLINANSFNCPAGRFTIETIPPASWPIPNQQNNILLDSYAKILITISVTSPIDAPDGTYQIIFRAVNEDFSQYQNSSTSVYKVDHTVANPFIVTKTSSKNIVNKDDEVLFTVTIENISPLMFQNLTLDDIIDPGFNYVLNSATLPPNCPTCSVSHNPVSHTITWDFPYIRQKGLSGDTISVSFSVIVI